MLPPVQSHCSTAGAEVRRSRTRRRWSQRKMTSYIPWQATSWVQFSITAVECLCVCCASVFMFVWVSVTMYSVRVLVCISSRGNQQDPGMGTPAHQDLTKWTDGPLWGVLSARSPLLQACHFNTPSLPPSPLCPLHPPVPAVHNLRNFIKANGHSFMVKPQFVISWESAFIHTHGLLLW